MVFLFCYGRPTYKRALRAQGEMAWKGGSHLSYLSFISLPLTIFFFFLLFVFLLHVFVC